MVSARGEFISIIRNRISNSAFSTSGVCVGGYDLQRIESVIVSPPLVDPYDVIKDKLLSIYDTSEDENLNQLLHGVRLGDRLPSEMLIHMQRLGGNNVGTGLLTKLFLERLPPIVRNIIVTTPCDCLTELAQRANRVFIAFRSFGRN